MAKQEMGAKVFYASLYILLEGVPFNTDVAKFIDGLYKEYSEYENWQTVDKPIDIAKFFTPRIVIFAKNLSGNKHVIEAVAGALSTIVPSVIGQYAKNPTLKIQGEPFDLAHQQAIYISKELQKDGTYRTIYTSVTTDEKVIYDNQGNLIMQPIFDNQGRCVGKEPKEVSFPRSGGCVVSQVGPNDHGGATRKYTTTSFENVTRELWNKGYNSTFVHNNLDKAKTDGWAIKSITDIKEAVDFMDKVSALAQIQTK